MNKSLIALASSGAFLVGAAHAVPVVGGVTTVDVTSFETLDEAGIAPGVLGSATVDGEEEGLVIDFPVTGGDLDPATLGGTIEHDGSGVSLSAGGNVVNLTDFVIDTGAGTLSGVVEANGATAGRVDLFTFDLTGLSGEAIMDTEDPAISLLLTEVAANALADSFGIAALSGLAGQEFGLAATMPSLGTADPIPAPGAAFLFATGAAAFGARRLSRR